MDQAKLSQIQDILPSLSRENALEVAGAIDSIVAALQPEAIYAFGSRARDDADTDSDIDLFVVVSRSDLPGYRLDQIAYAAIGAHLTPMDVVVATRDEFDRRARAASSLPATVLREGKLLYAA